MGYPPPASRGRQPVLSATARFMYATFYGFKAYQGTVTLSRTPAERDMTDPGEIIGPLIGLVCGTIAMSIPIIYIVTRSRRLQRAMELAHAERMAAIERGMELPAAPIELLGDQLAKAQRPRTALLPGLVWLFVGSAIGITRIADEDSAPLLIGLIPMGIGLAYLIYYFIEERKQLNAPQS